MKRFLSVIVIFTMLLTLVPMSAFAKRQYEPTTQELEAIIKKVRTTVEIPQEQTEFTWSYNSPSYRNRAGWSLNWNTPDYDSSTYIVCDSEGYINSYSFNDYNSRKPVLPTKAPDDKSFVASASSFISKLAPYADNHMVLKDARINSTLRSHTYLYEFVRMENGIVVPDNYAQVIIDYTTGVIRSCSIRYDRSLSFSKPENIISAEKARELISRKQSMTLSYKIKNEYDNDGHLLQRKAYLVYTPEISYISVDAFTGELYTERNTWEIRESAITNGAFGNTSMDKAEAEGAGDLAADDYVLTEKELEQLEVLKGLISRQDAIKTITDNEFLYLDKDATAVQTNLDRYKDYQTDEEKFVWRISFSKPYDDSKYSYNSYADASVDAKTGELISYNAGVPQFYDYQDSGIEIPALNYTQKQAKEIAEGFLKSTCPDRFSHTVQGEPTPEIILCYEKTQNGEYNYDKPVYRAYDISYIRTNEGVDFPYNSLNTRIDLVFGKVLSYRATWYDDIHFESPKDAITPEKALEIYHANEGFGINYEINSTYTYNKYLADSNDGDFIEYDKLYETSLHSRAVYSAYNMGTNIIGALTGKMLTYNAEEYVKKAKKSYSDIENHWAEDIILRFSYADIGFDQGVFMPNKAITAAEFSSFLNSCNVYGIYSEYNEDANPDSPITRTDAVKFIISYLGYEKIARLENVFITDFADNLSLKSDDIGFIAIAKGFGLINGDTSGFRPYDTLTRAEALQLILNLLSTDMLS